MKDSLIGQKVKINFCDCLSNDYSHIKPGKIFEIVEAPPGLKNNFYKVWVKGRTENSPPVDLNKKEFTFCVKFMTDKKKKQIEKTKKDFYGLLSWLTKYNLVIKKDNHINIVEKYLGMHELEYLENKESINNKSSAKEAIEFAEWLRTFELLQKKDGFWILDCQISSKELYSGFLANREDWLKNKYNTENITKCKKLIK